MKPTFFKTPAAFRAWFEAHHESEKELWVGYYKKASGKPSIDWPESVDQGLCFGWIDGIRKTIDAESYMIRFTPRRKQSHWSAVNIKRFAELEKEGLIQPAGKAAYQRRTEQNSVQAAYERGEVELSPEYIKEFKQNPTAWDYYEQLPPFAKKISTWFVMSAKREDTRLRRLRILIESSAKGERLPQFQPKKK